jgi:hypothetical protein
VLCDERCGTTDYCRGATFASAHLERHLLTSAATNIQAKACSHNSTV